MIGTAGIIVLNQYMPNGIKFEPGKAIDSNIFKDKMGQFAKKHPALYAKNINKIAHLGEKMAFFLGSNIGPKDLTIDDKRRSAVINNIDRKMKKAKNDDEKRNILLKGLDEAIGEVGKTSVDDNEIAQQVKSGSRGKPAQFARLAIGPVYSIDMNQIAKPVLIKNSFSKGLGSHEYFNVASQGRFSSVQASNATSEPGELGKILIANGEDMKITMKDCGTRNGTIEKKNDPHIVGMYLAGSNKLVTPELFKSMRKQGGTVMVRTPRSCKAPKGVCAMCYGLKPNGQLPFIGENVGLKASQSIGEVMVQMTLSTKHSVTGKNGKEELMGVPGFKAIANSPASFTGAAVVSTEKGRVSMIESAPQGGKYIHVGSKRYHVPKAKSLKVKMGDYVNVGQPLSSGIVTPKQIIETRNIGEAMRHESKLLHTLFKNSTGKDLQKKHFDVLAKQHLSLGQDKYGKLGDFNDLMSNYPRISKPAAVDKHILGKYFADDLGSYKKGTLVDEHILKKLKGWSIPRVLITDEKPAIKPIFKSLEQRPSFNESMFKKMNYRHLSKAVTDSIYRDRPDHLGEHSSDRARYSAGML